MLFSLPFVAKERNAESARIAYIRDFNHDNRPDTVVTRKLTSYLGEFRPSSFQPLASSLQNSPQELILDRIPPISKHDAWSKRPQSRRSRQPSRGQGPVRAPSLRIHVTIRRGLSSRLPALNAGNVP